MSSIDELRDTLQRHATLHDGELAGRSAAVAGRVRMVRRRRAGVAGLAVAVVAGVAGIAALPDGPDERTLAGVRVPDTLTSTGYTYEFADGVEADPGDRYAQVRLPKSDRPRLVSWATAGDDQRVRVSTRGERAFASSRPDFTDFLWVAPQTAPRVRVAADEQVALAVYELSEAPPEGATKHGVTFRPQVGQRELLAAEISDRGQGELELTFTMPRGTVAVVDFCTSSTDSMKDAPWANLAINGRPHSGSGCTGGADESFHDAGWPGGMSIGPGEQPFLNGQPMRPGDEVTLDLQLRRDFEGAAPMDDDQALLGLAVYSMPEDGEQVLGWNQERLLEHEGHIWRLVGVERANLAGGRRWVTDVPAASDRMLVEQVVTTRGGSTRVDTVIDGDVEQGTLLDSDSPQMGGTVGMLAPGQRVGLRVRGGAGADGALVFYELVE